MIFAHPHILWLLALAPAAAWTGSRRWASAALRLATITCLILALAGPFLPRQVDVVMHVAVVDLSGPPPSLGNFRADRWVAYGARAAVVPDAADPAVLQRLRQPLWPDDGPAAANLAAALALAGAEVPPASRGDVRLFTTGLSTHGDPAAEAVRLADRGIAITPTPLPAGPTPTVVVRSVSMPAAARVGQTVTAHVRLAATASATTTLTLRAGDADPVTTTVAVTPGEADVDLPVPLPKPGLTAVTAAVSPAPSPVMAAVNVGPPPEVLLVQDGATAGQAAGWADLLGDRVRLSAVSPEQLLDRPLTDVAAIVLADVPADRLPAAAQARLRQAVLDGTGLLLTGAARSFGPGGYDEAPLASLLPVRAAQQLDRADPSTALVLIIDTSGSMGGTPIDLAKEVARLAVDHLRPRDSVGLVEFYGGRRWAAPLEPLGDGAVIHRALERLSAGGGTVLYPAVEEAAFALRNVHARGKHVFILSDGGVEEAPFTTLARQMAEDGVAVTTVQCGPPDPTAGPDPLPDIARAGGGRYYAVPDAYGLPDVSFKRPRESPLSALVRTPTAVLAGAADPLVGSADLGTVAGYVRTEPKPTADVLLRTASGEPLMVRWRYGAGFVAAVPMQVGSTLTRDAAGRPPFAAAVAGLVRQLGAGRASPLRITTTVRPAGIDVAVAAVDAGLDRAARPLTLTLSDAAGRPLRTIVAQPVAAGRWDVLLPGVPAGVYRLTADGVAAAVAVPPPQVVPDPALLNQLASFAPRAAAHAAPGRRTEYLDLQPWLAVAAVVALLGHVAARRWPA